MKYAGVVYFAGPATIWGRQPAEIETVFSTSGRYLWLVRLLTRSAHGPLNPKRVGYCITIDGHVIEQVHAGVEVFVHDNASEGATP